MIVLALCFEQFVAGHATNQVFGQFANPSEDLFLLAQRPLQHLLNEGQIALSEGRYAEGITALYALVQDDNEALPEIDRGQDFFLEHDPEGLYRSSIKAKVLRILADLPAAARETLELQYGVTARQELNTALEEADFERVAFVARNYPHTAAGYDALVVLSQHRLMSGNLLHAARTYQLLLDSPVARARFGANLAKYAALAYYLGNRSAQAEQTLLEAADLFPGQGIEIDGRQLSLASTENWKSILESAQVVQDLRSSINLQANWMVGGGTSERSGRAACGMPLTNARWVKEIHSSVLEGEAILNLKESRMRGGQLMLPKSELRIVDNLILTRTTDASLLAIDFETGNIRWPYFQLTLPNDGGRQNYQGSGVRLDQVSPKVQNRLWGSAAFGRFSCDVDRVYVVDESTAGRRMREASTLSCLSIVEEGSLKWQVGGEDGGSERRLANAYFLGPPLAYQGSLYCLIDVNGSTQLTVLDPSSGQLRWRQQLASSVYPPIAMDQQRQSQALSPTISDGVIVCPTGLGVVVAVDLGSRQLLWGMAYDKGPIARRSEISGFMNGNRFDPLDQSWQDAAVVASNGYFILTPPETDRLIIGDLLTGEATVKDGKRNRARYVAGIINDRALLVSENRLAWVQLSDGRSSVGPDFPDNKSLAGKGVFEGDTILLPLTGQTVARFRVDDGELLEQTQVDQPLGSLFAYQKQLLSISETAVAAFFTKESLSDLLTDRQADTTAEDVWVLNQRAQLAVSRLELDEALELLKRALQSEPENTDSRYLMAEVLLAALEKDFPRYAGIAQEFQQVIEFGPQRFRFLQQLALGNIRAGDHVAAFERLMTLMQDRLDATYSPAPSRTTALHVKDGHDVDSDCWIRTNLARAYHAAPASDLARIQKMIAAELSEIGTQVISQRRQKLDFFQWLPPAEQAILDLSSDLIDQGESVAAEHRLNVLLHSRSDSTTKAAQFLLAKMPDAERLKLAKYGDASRLYAYSQEFRNVERDEILQALQGKTPGELQWNSGFADVTFTNRMDYMHGAIVPQTIERFGRPDLRVSMAGQQLVVYSGLGEDVARLSYDRAIADTSDEFLRANIRGSLLILESMSEVAAFDLQRGLRDRSDAMLWRHSLVNNDGLAKYEPPGGAPMKISNLGFPTSLRKVGNSVVVVGPLTPGGIPVQNGSSLQMLDTLTGRILWQRDGFTGEAQMASSGTELAVATFRSNRMYVEVLDVRDGLTLRSSNSEGQWQRWFAHNDLVVDFRERFDGTGTGFEYPMTLRVWNPFTGDEVALEELQAGARATHFEERFLIVAEPEKGIHFFDLRNSSAITHRVFELPLTYGLDSLHAARFQNQLVVFSNGEADGKNVRSPLLYDPIRISRISAPVNGFVYGFDIKTGELLWDKPGQLYNMTFPTIQPTDSPFMLLYQVHERTKLASCAMIDIRYGSFVFAEHLLQADTDGFSMRLLPLKQQIVANVGMKGLLISFSDSTRAPQPVFSFRAR